MQERKKHPSPSEVTLGGGTIVDYKQWLDDLPPIKPQGEARRHPRPRRVSHKPAQNVKHIEMTTSRRNTSLPCLDEKANLVRELITAVCPKWKSEKVEKVINDLQGEPRQSLDMSAEDTIEVKSVWAALLESSDSDKELTFHAFRLLVPSDVTTEELLTMFVSVPLTPSCMLNETGFLHLMKHIYPPYRGGAQQSSTASVSLMVKKTPYSNLLTNSGVIVQHPRTPAPRRRKHRFTAQQR